MSGTQTPRWALLGITDPAQFSFLLHVCCTEDVTIPCSTWTSDSLRAGALACSCQYPLHLVQGTPEERMKARTAEWRTQGPAFPGLQTPWARGIVGGAPWMPGNLREKAEKSRQETSREWEESQSAFSWWEKSDFWCLKACLSFHLLLNKVPQI